MTSPCSVNLRCPSTEPGAWARIARFAGPPPRPIAPPRPWNSVSAHAVPPRGVHQRLLRPVQQPVRGQEPALLGRVRVAEHHLLGVAARRGGARGTPGPRAARRAAARRPPAPRRTPAAARRRGRAGRPAGRRGPAAAPRRRTARGSGGQARELQDVGHVPAPGRERDHVPPAGLDAEARLEARDRPERRQDLGQRHARPRPRRPARRRRRSASSAARVDGRVLADLERGEVEPERRDLPAQVGELAVRHAPQPVRGERLLDDRQLRVQGGRRSRSRRRAARSRRSARPGSGAAAPRSRPGAAGTAPRGSGGGAGGRSPAAPPRRGRARCRARGPPAPAPRRAATVCIRRVATAS